MYAYNGFGRRRPEGYSERRRYFRKLLAKAQPESREKTKSQTDRASK